MIKNTNIDISLEYNCSQEEFIGHKVLEYCHSQIWISYHTNKGKNYIAKFTNAFNTVEPHVRILLDNDLAQRIYLDTSAKNISKLFGGFYYKDKEHKTHV